MKAITSLAVWTRQVGVSSCTVWRWRKQGWLKTVNIAGKLYLTAEAIEEFNDRASRGEFARQPVMPRREEACA
ncbi:MAG: hypothetical protein KDM81_22945 [Verrucomicrobiae bacterium]|nr:hypothetical protein [Verrucomicrobiae bacterium]